MVGEEGTIRWVVERYMEILQFLQVTMRVPAVEARVGRSKDTNRANRTGGEGSEGREEGERELGLFLWAK